MRIVLQPQRHRERPPRLYRGVRRDERRPHMRRRRGEGGARRNCEHGEQEDGESGQ